MAVTDPQYLQRVGLLFRSVNVNFREAIDAALRERGVDLSFPQVSALSILEANPGVNGAQIARLAMVTPQAMTSVLKTLVAGRLVERSPHPDSLRADSWAITARGRKVLADARVALEEVTSRMLSGLGAWEVADLERFLRACAGALEVPDSAGGRKRAPPAPRRVRS